MKKKTRKSTAGILALMSVSVLLLSILVYLWLCSQYKDEKQALTKDLQYELKRAQESLSESMMYDGFLKPLMSDIKISKAKPSMRKNVITISMEENINIDSLKTKGRKINIKSKNAMEWEVSKSDNIEDAKLNEQMQKQTMNIGSDKEKAEIVREGMTLMINELIQLDSTNGQMNLLKLDTAKLHKLLTITATSVEPGVADVKKIVKPAEGKKMTEKQFEAMMVEKAKEMGVEGGHGANITIKTERR